MCVFDVLDEFFDPLEFAMVCKDGGLFELLFFNKFELDFLDSNNLLFRLSGNRVSLIDIILNCHQSDLSSNPRYFLFFILLTLFMQN